MRKLKFTNNEYYHVFNRGVDKRNIFIDKKDMDRFFQSMGEFNAVEPIGSIYENSFNKEQLGSSASKLQKGKLAEFVCYCLNPNHYHFLLKQVSDKGVEKFMHRLGTGYTKYFNQRYKRNGSLFQGRFKAVHVGSNEQLLYLSVYINLNNKIHSLGSSASKSSWDEYVGEGINNFCNKDIISGQFRNKLAYRKFAEDSLKDIQQRKKMEKLLLD